MGFGTVTSDELVQVSRFFFTQKFGVIFLRWFNVEMVKINLKINGWRKFEGWVYC